MNPNDEKQQPDATGALEGEGNKTADKQYREAATTFARGGEAMKKGLEAQRDLESNPEQFKDAEARGRAPAGSGDDLPNDISGKSFEKK
ncbi:MAG: hypothetical protein NVS4B10_22940 [Myxococcales bacterium]